MKIKTVGGKQQVFCEWRKRYVRLTPEEWVRQQTLSWLETEYHYPHSRIAVEQSIQVGETQKRCDAVIYNDSLKPVCIIEFKAETVALQQKVFDQVAVYNRALQVEYFYVCNGTNGYFCKVNEQGYDFLTEIPTYEILCQKK